MGMYTELHFNVELKKNVPDIVLDTLKYMTDGNLEDKPKEIPDHPFFNCSRWTVLFRMDSYYFASDTHSTLRLDDISQTHYLCVRSNLKNYDSEISHFLDWIMPHVDAFDGDFLGFSRYEESEEPQIIRKV